jgi:hypothetical protein
MMRCRKTSPLLAAHLLIWCCAILLRLEIGRKTSRPYIGMQAGVMVSPQTITGNAALLGVTRRGESCHNGVCIDARPQGASLVQVQATPFAR